TPFECVGSADEARLALALANARHALPPPLAALAAAAPAPPRETLRTFVEVLDRHNMPPHVADRIMPLLREAAAAAARRLGV
ncbi:MAG TPA: hypothetical protein VLT45_05195, partial [Kofleriaceae bacterium]|nr:hypothetical protein [Kofleriaceae bacterium]